jgi:hypothetical protein
VAPDGTSISTVFPPVAARNRPYTVTSIPPLRAAKQRMGWAGSPARTPGTRL